MSTLFRIAKIGLICALAWIPYSADAAQGAGTNVADTGIYYSDQYGYYFPYDEYGYDTDDNTGTGGTVYYYGYPYGGYYGGGHRYHHGDHSGHHHGQYSHHHSGGHHGHGGHGHH